LGGGVDGEDGVRLSAADCASADNCLPGVLPQTLHRALAAPGTRLETSIPRPSVPKL